MGEIMRRNLERLWERYEIPITLIGATAALLIWAYSNFATGSERESAKKELRTYVDIRHAEVKGELHEIKDMQKEQRDLSNTILIELRKR
jgi:hypothetical protein